MSYDARVKEMMRRAEGKGRVSRDGTRFEVTISDAKQMRNWRFPREMDGMTVNFDPEARELIVVKGDNEMEDILDCGVEQEVSQTPNEETPIAPLRDEEGDPIPTPDSEGDGETCKNVESESEVSGVDDDASESDKLIEESTDSPEDEEEARDYLMWVGGASYPTIEHFVSEAEKLGVSKRISKIPKNMKVGQSRIFLAHDEGIKGDGVIFGYFTLGAIEMIVRDGGKIPPELAGKIRPVTRMEASKEPERGCGWRTQEGAMYAVCRIDEDTMMRLQTISPDTAVKGSLVVFDEPRDYNKLVNSEAKRFRSMMKINGDKIITSKDVKSNPLSRAPKNIDIELEALPKSGESWSDIERVALLKHVKKSKSKYQAFRDFSRQTNRSVQSIIYQYEKLIGVRDSKGNRLKSDDLTPPGVPFRMHEKTLVEKAIKNLKQTKKEA